MSPRPVFARAAHLAAVRLAAARLVGVGLALLVVAGALAGCSGSNRVTHASAEEAFMKGKDLYDRGKYDKAIPYFRAVFDYGRGNEWADDAQYFLACSYREQKQYLLAATEFRRFTQIYRRSQRLPLAEFERARAYDLRSPMYKLDQTDTEKAISYYLLYLEHHPTHEFAARAEERVRALRAKLAHKMYDAAQLYENREMYVAATETYESVFDQYPDTPFADDALVGAIRSYIGYADLSVSKRQAPRLEKALDRYDLLLQVFPESDLLREAEDLYEQARAKLEAVRAREAERQRAADSLAQGEEDERD
jgi:outer membrane protein assembly factor BamD